MTDPRTIEHITSASLGPYSSCDDGRCFVDSMGGTRRWFLCGFHKGYEAGLEAAEPIPETK